MLPPQLLWQHGRRSRDHHDCHHLRLATGRAPLQRRDWGGKKKKRRGLLFTMRRNIGLSCYLFLFLSPCLSLSLSLPFCFQMGNPSLNFKTDSFFVLRSEGKRERTGSVHTAQRGWRAQVLVPYRQHGAKPGGAGCPFDRGTSVRLC